MSPRARLALFYLLLMGSIGGLNPWMAVLLDEADASAAQKALILAAFPVGVLVAGPFGAWIADRTRREIRVLQVAAALTLAASLALVGATGLVGLALGTAGLAMARAPLPPVTDMVAVRHVGLGERGYGSVRAWGSVGFILAALAVGRLMDGWLRAPLWIAAGMAAAMLALTLFLPPPPPRSSPAGTRGDLGRLLKDPVLLSLCAVAVLHRGTIGFYDMFFALHTASLDLPSWVPGLSFALGVTVEVGVLAMGHRLLERWGPLNLVILAVVTGIPRWLVTGTVDSAGGLIAVQAIHGLGFGAWWVGGVALVTRHAPEDLRNTGQGMFMAAGHGLGSFLALGIAALMLDRTTSGAAFLLQAGVSALAAVVVLVALRPALRRAGSPTGTPSTRG